MFHRLLSAFCPYSTTELQDTLGGDRQITICKELTKRYENSMEFTLESACEYYENNEPRGEYYQAAWTRVKEEYRISILSIIVKIIVLW